MTVEAFEAKATKRLAELRRRRSYPGDLISRNPKLSAPQASVAFRLTERPETATAVDGAAVTIVVPAEQGQLRVLFDSARLPRVEAEGFIRRVQVAAAAFTTQRQMRVANLPLMSAGDMATLLHDRNRTERDYDRSALVHELIERQSGRTPDATALVCGGRALTYAELDARANAVAAALRKQGAGPDKLVGIYMHRSVDLVVGALGILKAGAAYVPLDPTYPADRIALMIEDSGLTAILTDKTLAASAPAGAALVIDVEDAANSGAGNLRPVGGARPENLAYVIYTSGSTGRPKGVMVEHRNVANFFAGMDDRIAVPSEGQPVWLAVTSLSFDISVLELFWTLTRGFKVVINVDDKRAAAGRPHRKAARATGGMDFGLFFWGMTMRRRQTNIIFCLRAPVSPIVTVSGLSGRRSGISTALAAPIRTPR
jgi:non-ribosomal peptide synthetase component F